MCYSSQLVVKADDGGKDSPRLLKRLQGYFAEKNQPQLFYANAFSRPEWPVITAEDPEEVQGYQWGLVPAWAKDAATFLKKAPTFNAVSATAFEKPSYRSAMAKGRRCLVPVTGFYEWHHLGKEKFPHFIHLKGRDLFCLAGIYEKGTYSILTTEANPLMARIHNSRKRMPVILSEADEATWLHPDLTKEEVLDLCRPYPDEEMEAWPVSKAITKRDRDPNTPEASVPVEHPELHGAFPPQ